MYGEPLNLVDGGQSKRSFCYIKDAINAVLLMIDNPDRANGKIFNVGNPNNEVTVQNLAEMLMKVYAKVTSDSSISDLTSIDLSSEKYFPYKCKHPDQQQEKVSLVDIEGPTVLYRKLMDLENSDNQILKDLFVDIKRKHASEELTLSYLANNEYFCLLRGSLHQGRSPNKIGQDGKTALHIAANKEKDDLVELLLQHGANPNSCDQDGKTPLHIVANKGRRRIIDLLLQYGANPNSKGV